MVRHHIVEVQAENFFARLAVDATDPVRHLVMLGMRHLLKNELAPGVRMRRRLDSAA